MIQADAPPAKERRAADGPSVGSVGQADARLVERAREGDGAAFERLVRRHLGPAYAVALAVLGSPADAEDACQDAFVTALERLNDCRSPERFAPWLHQIVRNRARDLLRREATRRAVSIDAAAGLAGRESPAVDAERAELRERLVESLTLLSEVQREVLLLHDLEGWRHGEIADRLELPEGTVRAHLFHARRVLRARLGADLPQEI
jgi:RNA polymerase sigma-70 factor (ECF subfamily)